MLNPNMVLGWEEVEHDLYEENGYVFGVELDLFNGHENFYAKETDKNGNIYYYELSNDIYKAINEFNEIMEKNTLCP
jgi:hypothetical protein